MICIDGHNLALPNGSGIATYSRSLLSAIKALGIDTAVLHAPGSSIPREALLREVMLKDARIWSKAFVEGRPNRRVQAAFAILGKTARPVLPSGRILWPDQPSVPEADAFWLSTDLFRIANRAFSDHRVLTAVNLQPSEVGRPNLMHWTYPAPLRARGICNIYTLHDLIPLKLPHTTLDDKKRYFDLCRAIAARADHIVTVSETTRRDVISLLGVDEERVSSTLQPGHLPPGALHRSESRIATEIEDIFDLGWKDYFIFFGAAEPKKNIGRLVQAYLRSGVRTPLVVVAGPGWLEDEEVGFLDEVIARGNGSAASRLYRYDYLPRPMLIDLVRGAKATLFPSLYEGFGLPVIESMMLGTPVVAADTGSLREIAGSAARLVNPYDVDEIARAIRDVDADEGLRIALTEAGYQRASLFTPEAFKARMATLYRSLGVFS